MHVLLVGVRVIATDADEKAGHSASGELGRFNETVVVFNDVYVVFGSR